MNKENRICFKHDFIKEFMKSCLIVSDISDAEFMASLLLRNDLNTNKIYFPKSSLKIIFFNKVKNYNNDIKIINCDCSVKRFNEELLNINNNIVIFNNIDKCDRLIFESIKDLNNCIYVC